ncbi:c-type cytochrome [Thermithiobacillus plumbiphilus]|uniref:C-type cytochrome n=1 Tax=Thermithiobacillus plumbiphilus TaxID=1729899 RepID=A0ABU9D4T0_9PROT
MQNKTSFQYLATCVLLGVSFSLAAGCGKQEENEANTPPPAISPAEKASKTNASPNADVRGAAGPVDSGPKPADSESINVAGRPGNIDIPDGKNKESSMSTAESGQAIMQKSDCMSCHAVDRKMVGPAYAWVAYRYKGDSTAVDKLADKIKVGGAGNWNDLTGGIPMPAHPQLTQGQTKAMAEWILSQKPVEPPKG